MQNFDGVTFILPMRHLHLCSTQGQPINFDDPPPPPLLSPLPSFLLGLDSACGEFVELQFCFENSRGGDIEKGVCSASAPCSRNSTLLYSQQFNSLRAAQSCFYARDIFDECHPLSAKICAIPIELLISAS